MDTKELFKQIEAHLTKLVVGVVLTGFTLFIRRGYDERETRLKIIATELQGITQELSYQKYGLKALMSESLEKRCRAHLKARSITIEDLNQLEALFKAYKELGGNGTVAELYRRCTKLKIREEDMYDGGNVPE